MFIVERIHMPRLGIERKQFYVSPEEVAQILISGYLYKGHKATAGISVVQEAKRLSKLDNNPVGDWIVDPHITWRSEVWPISFLRATRMYPPENDPQNLHRIVENSGKKFGLIATALESNSSVVNNDVGFQPNPERDGLPIFGIRGRLHNHIVDGHHRTILAVWEGRKTMPTLTAYKK